MYKKGDELEISIETQSIPVVEDAIFWTEFDGTQEAVVVCLDVHPDGCEDDGWSSGGSPFGTNPCYWLAPPEDTVLAPTSENKPYWTVVAFTQLKGYRIMAVNVDRTSNAHFIALIKAEQ